MEKVTLLPTDESSNYFKEHIAGRHGKGSMTIGSKILDSVADDYMLNLLKETDRAYQQAIDEKGTPGRMVFAVEADKPIGTNAVFPIENLDKSAVFSTTRDIGERNESKISCVLVSENDMPKTNLAQVIMGHYGPTGNAGIYTMIMGDEGMPFSSPNPEFDKQCKEYWNSHVFLVTPKELEANIAELKEHGVDTKRQEQMLKLFQVKGEKSPILKPFHPKASATATKINLSQKTLTHNKGHGIGD